MKTNKYKEMELSFEEFANQIGIDDLETPEVYEIKEQGYEILSVEPDTGKEVWKPIENFIVKPKQDFYYDLNGLIGTHEHKVLYNKKWTKLAEHPEAKRVESPTQVVDLTVADTHTYKCGNQINHNTVTPGGMAIPYACSVRVRITSTGQKQVKDKNGNVVGIQVKAKTIKNKVARPFRECEFQIHFGVGIVEHEEVFDLFRNHCSELKGVSGVAYKDKFVSVEGTGAWKTFSVIDKKGKIVHEEKFYKPEFGRVLYNPEYKEYMDALYEASLTMLSSATEHSTFTGVDLSSAEEVKALQEENEP